MDKVRVVLREDKEMHLVPVFVCGSCLDFEFLKY